MNPGSSRIPNDDEDGDDQDGNDEDGNANNEDGNCSDESLSESDDDLISDMCAIGSLDINLIFYGGRTHHSSLLLGFFTCRLGVALLPWLGAPLQFIDVLKALRDNERMTGNDSSSSSDKLLLADDSGRGRNFQRSSSKGRSKSRMGGDRDMSEKKKVDGGEMNVVDNGGDEFLKTETSMYGILREEKTKWVLDNAASSHICNDRAMFETLNGKGQFGEIKMGSKQMMKIEGVGSVPGAARNILSLGVLTSRKVYKRDQLVIRGRKILNNLCYLEGEALQGMTFCGGNKGKKKIEKRVHFLDKDEVLGILTNHPSYEAFHYRTPSLRNSNLLPRLHKSPTTPYDGSVREEKTKWVLDNAASSHICNDRAMFETLNGKGQFGEIKMGSKQMMKIEGVGSVPGVARNILSLDVLTSRKVYKRDQLVIRGWKILNNLCYLEGEALQGRTFCGGNKGKKKIEKRVHFSDKDEVLGILRLCVLDCCFKKMASDMSKFSIPMFDGKMDFTMWKMTIEDVLVQQGIDEVVRLQM
ncbi:hypothetical protein Tco_0486492 [Tanacetum coccineum]